MAGYVPTPLITFSLPCGHDITVFVSMAESWRDYGTSFFCYECGDSHRLTTEMPHLRNTPFDKCAIESARDYSGGCQ